MKTRFKHFALLTLLMINFNVSHSQNLKSLDSEYGICGIKLGSHIDSIKAIYKLSGPVYEDQEPELERWEIEDQPYLSCLGVTINHFFYLHFINNKLYKIQIRYMEQSGATSKVGNALFKLYGVRENRPNSGGLRFWETKAVRLTAYLNEDEKGELTIYAKKFEPLPKKKQEPITTIVYKKLLVKTEYVEVPPGKVWVVNGLVINKNYVDNWTALYYDFNGIVPTTYTDIITQCSKCSIIFGKVENCSKEGLHQAVDNGSMPITQLPKQFPEGYKLRTENTSLMLEVLEYPKQK